MSSISIPAVKGRGHLGSQLERKAETNLRLDNVDGVTTIWSENNAASLSQKTPALVSSGARSRHARGDPKSPGIQLEIEKEELRALVEDLFSDRPSMRYRPAIYRQTTVVLPS